MPDKGENEQALILSCGINVVSKTLLKDSRIKNIIVESLLGSCTAGALYKLGDGKWSNKSVTDVLYVPRTKTVEDLPPILVKTQDIVDTLFMSKAIQSCTWLYEKYEVLPILLVISPEGYSSETFKKKFKLSEESFLAEAYCEFWAKQCLLLSPETIKSFLTNDPLNKLVALGYFFIDPKMSLQRHDPTIRLILEIVEGKLGNAQ